MNDSSSGSRRRFLLGLAAVLAITLLVRIGPLLLVTHVSPDAVEYVDVARNWADQGAPLLSIKAYYHVATDVVHHGGWVRPLLFPALLALTGHPSLETGAWLGTIAALILVALAACFFARVYGGRVGLWAALLVGLAPPVLEVSCFALADTLSTAAVVAALVAVVAPRARNGSGEHPAPAIRDRRGVHPVLVELAAGLALGLAAAFRPVNVVYGLPVVVYLWTRRSGAAARVRAVGFVALGPLLFVLAQGALNTAHGVPFFTFAQSFLYRVDSLSDAMRNFYPRAIAPSAVDFVVHHPAMLMKRIARHTASYGVTLLLDPRFLLFWLPALALLAFRAFRLRLSAEAWLALGVALTGFLVHCLTWSTFDVRRFLLVPLVLLTGLAVGQVLGRREGAARMPGWSVVLLAGCLLYYGGWAVHRFGEAVRLRAAGKRYLSFAEQQAWNDPVSPALAAWLQATMPARARSVACGSPWWLHLVTGRPTALWPASVKSQEQLEAYVRICPVDAVLFDRSRDPPGGAAFFRGLPAWRECSRGQFTLLVRQAGP